MLSFLYNSHYLSPAGNLAVHVDMYAMGDIFDLPRLSKYAQYKFIESLNRISDEKTFLSLIPRIYESTPESDRGLRDVAVWKARRRYYDYTKNLDHKDAFDEALKSTWLFTKDLLADFAFNPLVGPCSNCGPGQVFRATKKACTKCHKLK